MKGHTMSWILVAVVVAMMGFNFVMGFFTGRLFERDAWEQETARRGFARYWAEHAPSPGETVGTKWKWNDD